MDGDPPVGTSGAANREARQHGSEEAGSEAWLVSEEAARQQAAARQPGWSISTTRGRPPSQQGQPASSGLARPQRIRRRNGWWDGIGGSGSVAGCLVAAPERGCQGILFGGEYDDRGWGGWMAGGRQQDWPTTAPPPATQHQPQPHHTNAPLGGSTNPTAPCILSTGHSPSTWCPREILGTGV